MMGNNALYEAVGIRNVMIKMHDESVIELKQVRCVLELKRNLISLGMMDRIGCVVRVQNGVLNVLKGS